eukprot:TRINITY_DN12797_c0_g1_i1.p1 TRINITY_DN12797_c0_g1~~TRINITY_DN12797_c0_g1_i1.p1  ORF type:complete len:779 (-),score=111.86 TRINITY_DN12797_c0_g1_i1:384-2720(-)
MAEAPSSSASSSASRRARQSAARQAEAGKLEAAFVKIRRLELELALHQNRYSANVQARLSALAPALEAQETAAARGLPAHSSSGLLPPDDHVMATAARHQFAQDFRDITPAKARRSQRGARRAAVSDCASAPSASSARSGSSSADEEASSLQGAQAAPPNSSRILERLSSLERQFHSITEHSVAPIDSFNKRFVEALACANSVFAWGSAGSSMGPQFSYAPGVWHNSDHGDALTAKFRDLLNVVKTANVSPEMQTQLNVNAAPFEPVASVIVSTTSPRCGMRTDSAEGSQLYCSQSSTNGSEEERATAHSGQGSSKPPFFDLYACDVIDAGTQACPLQATSYAQTATPCESVDAFTQVDPYYPDTRNAESQTEPCDESLDTIVPDLTANSACVKGDIKAVSNQTPDVFGASLATSTSFICTPADSGDMPALFVQAQVNGIEPLHDTDVAFASVAPRGAWERSELNDTCNAKEIAASIQGNSTTAIAHPSACDKGTEISRDSDLHANGDEAMGEESFGSPECPCDDSPSECNFVSDGLELFPAVLFFDDFATDNCWADYADEEVDDEFTSTAEGAADKTIAGRRVEQQPSVSFVTKTALRSNSSIGPDDRPSHCTDHNEAVQNVKTWQRLSKDHAKEWRDHCDVAGGGLYDPGKHSCAFLTSWISQMEARHHQITNGNAPSRCSGKGKSSTKGSRPRRSIQLHEIRNDSDIQSLLEELVKRAVSVLHSERPAIHHDFTNLRSKLNELVSIAPYDCDVHYIAQGLLDKLDAETANGGSPG